jgi:hypothetical protein
MKFKLALLCSLGLAAAGNALACYTVYDSSNKVVYNAQTPPVDMRLPLHETLPRVFPGGHMVFQNGAQCPLEQPLPRLAVRGTGGVAPLLTDRATAQAMNAPHTILASGAALVEQRPANMSPGVMVASSAVALPAPAAAPVAVAATQAPDTSVMGAGPARYRSNVMITEMRDGMTVVETVQTR